MSHFAKVSKDVVSVKLICNYTVFYSYILLNNEIKQSELKLTHTPSFIRTSIFRVEPGPFLFSDQFAAWKCSYEIYYSLHIFNEFYKYNINVLLVSLA